MEDSENKRKFTVWVKKHKRELTIAGIGVSTLLLTILACNNLSFLETLWNQLKNKIGKTSITVVNGLSEKAYAQDISKTVENAVRKHPTAPFDVSGHIRNLHAGWKPSEEKIKEALRNGIKLSPHQTWVSAYTKGTIS